MAIEFKARVLLELGAELISSDAVAIYELVKNSVDARSTTVSITFEITMQHSEYRNLHDYLKRIESEDSDESEEYSCSAFLAKIAESFDPDATERNKQVFLERVGRPRTLSAAQSALDEAFFQGNSIQFTDTGVGMTQEILKKGYLTIGTPMRLLQKGVTKTPTWTKQSETQPTLGEKGIGRLAAMRLGHYVLVETVTADPREKNWNSLELDWRPIFSDPDLDASALDYEPEPGHKKTKPDDHGTTITIRALQSDWTEQKLNQLNQEELVKLTDPFKSDFIQEFLSIRLQRKKILLPEFENNKLNRADAVCRARFEKSDGINGNGPLRGLQLVVEVDYKHYPGAKRTWHIHGEHLASCVSDPPARRRKPKSADALPDSPAVIAALPRLGPFEMQFYWYNRGRMMRKQSDVWADISRFVNAWRGGLLVYRDGFRVHPYGSATDDWLDLDRSALSASAYKLNRSQIIGYLRISQKGNPALLDQTNREGFRDCPEKEALKRLLRHIFITRCRRYLEDVAKERKDEDPEPLESLEDRVDASESTAVRQLHQLQERVPEESESITEIIFQIGEIRDAWERAKATIKDQENDLEQYVHLAGVGLQVEFIAHELSRITGDALKTLAENREDEAARRGLQAQLHTLEKRIRVLDLLSIPGRQRKTLVNLNELALLLQEMHTPKLNRHGIEMLVRESRTPFKARVEKGQILQILDNLFSNSCYWLGQRFDQSKRGQIVIDLDGETREVKFSDNGPGIPPDMTEDIFKPFITTKPPTEGRGLGLFISRRLAEYNDATLDLSPAKRAGMHHTFILSLKNTKET